MSSSSQESESSRRCCPGCNKRMSSLVHDRHTFCSGCRGRECDEASKCEECREWSKESFEKYLKHQRTLVAKAKSKAKKDDPKEPSDSSSGGTGVDHPGQGDRGNSGSGLSEQRILALIEQSIAKVSSSFSDVMNESYVNITAMVEEKIDQARQANITPLSGIPSHPPVSSPTCHRQRDPSRFKPQSTYGNVGAEPVESEGAEMTVPPQDILASLRRAGVVVPESVARTVFPSKGSSGDGRVNDCPSQGSLNSQGIGSGSGGVGLSQGLVSGSASQGLDNAARQGESQDAQPSQGSVGTRDSSTGVGDGSGGLSQGTGVRLGSASWFDGSLNRGTGIIRG